jgi:hypothetical protein
MLEKQLKETNAKQSYARKREHSPTPEFKYKRNKVQYELKKSILGKIETSLDASDDEECSGALDEGRKMLTERNKHIKLAKKYGWEAVDCYMDELLASDSDDDKKIRRAIKQSKVLNKEKRKAARASRLPVNSSQSRVGIQLQRIPNESNFHQVVKGPLAHCQLRTPHVFVVDEKAIMPVTADLSSPLTTPLALQITSKDCTEQTRG